MPSKEFLNRKGSIWERTSFEGKTFPELRREMDDRVMAELKDYPDVMNIEEMCSALGICTKTGYRLLKDGSIQGRKVGGKYRIPKIHLLSYLKVCDLAG